MNRAVFWDRDGVLNQAIVRNNIAYAPLCQSEFVLVPEALQCIERLKQEDLLMIVVTNQPEVAHGSLSWDELDAMHSVLRESIPVDDVLVCPHADDDACECRKPKPGLLLTAQRKWNIDLEHSFLIGDRWRDIGAGEVVGCYTVLIDRPYSGDARPNYRAATISEATNHIAGITMKVQKR